MLWLFVAITMVLGYNTTQLRIEAGFTKMVPLEHEYMKTFRDYQQTFGGGDQVSIALMAKQGNIFTKDFLETLRKAHDEVFYTPGVERSSVTSLFSPNVRYIEIIENGYAAYNIISSDFKGTPEQLQEVRAKLIKSDWLGRIVANDLSGALIVATLLDRDPETGARLDLTRLSKRLDDLRAKFENANISVHIIGFAKASGDIARGVQDVLTFFGIAFVITALLLYWYSGSPRLTGLALACATMPVIWLLGLLPLIGLSLDPMSILVPFLIFSIAVSHAVQMTNAWKLETLHGSDGVTASRNSFRKLFVPGTMALLANAIGFLVIAFVKIDMVRELTITATLGVTMMIVTNKMLLPILLSYMKISPAEAQRFRGKESSGDWLWVRFARLTERRTAIVAVGFALALGLLAGWYALGLKVGDLGKGVPELRSSARYNQDVEVIAKSFSVGTDVFSVIAQTHGVDSPCIDSEIMDTVDRFEFFMRQLDGVQSVRGPTGLMRAVNTSYAEGNLKWRVLPDNRPQMAQTIGFATKGGGGFFNSDCSAMQIAAFTNDHQAPTIARIVDEVKRFKSQYDTDKLTFRLASGNVGVMAATNEEVAAADKLVNLALFVSVALLCLVEFRSVAITLCIVLPLGLVTILCNALMTFMDIGLKVNTLPVVALGVGVGVDYGIYLFDRINHGMRNRGQSLREAYLDALRQRGTASVFTAFTMTIGVATWIFSALKFQADMGILLAFMFMVNVLGAIILLPAIAAFLLKANIGGKGRVAAQL
ncbi:MAG: efflux RND transporter permease subunit [Proteobacteria bacterium]|nr:efflux RND transporter permease subunit [Pseudomonadota bacterium]